MRVAAVELPAEVLWAADPWPALDRAAGRAVEAGAGLVCLGGLAGLAGLVEAGRVAGPRPDDPAAAVFRDGYGGDVARGFTVAVWEQVPLVSQPPALDWARRFARDRRVWLVAGTFLLPAGAAAALPTGPDPPAGRPDAWVHAAPLVTPGGEVAGWQVQTHPTGAEAARGMAAGRDLQVFDAGGLRLGLAVGGDAWVPEVGRILALLGAEALLAPVAVPRPYPYWAQVAGLWQIVQQNQVYGLEVGLGSRGDLPWRARTAAFGPCEITPDETGWLDSLSGPVDDAGLLLADFDGDRLAGIRARYPIFAHLNPALYRRYLPAVYRARVAGGPAAGPDGPAGAGGVVGGLG